MYLLGTVAAVARAYGIVVKERIVASVVVVALVALGNSWDGVALLFVVDVVLLVTLLAEFVRIERPRPSGEPADEAHTREPR